MRHTWQKPKRRQRLWKHRALTLLGALSALCLPVAHAKNPPLAPATKLTAFVPLALTMEMAKTKDKKPAFKANKKSPTRAKRQLAGTSSGRKARKSTKNRAHRLSSNQAGRKRPGAVKKAGVKKTARAKTAKRSLAEAKQKNKKPSRRSVLKLKRRIASKKPHSAKSAKQQSSRRNNQQHTTELGANHGWKIPYIKRGGGFQKMKLKKGDIILRLEGRPVRSKKDLQNRLSGIIKKQKGFSLTVARGGKSFLISYKIVPFKRKKRLKITAVRESGPDSPSISAKPGAKKTAHKPAQKAKPTKNPANTQEPSSQALVPEKYKNRLQLAFISSLNSFVYERPDFDSQQLLSLQPGQRVLVSKKIFRPEHKFGSFHKIFLAQPQKIVGYVSEAEVIAEFLKNKKGKGQSPNPIFKKARRQIKRDGALDINLKNEIQRKTAAKRKTKPSDSSGSSGKKTYIGFSAGLLQFYKTSEVSEKDILFGLKLSGYRLLLSSLNTDINVLAAPYDMKFFHLDAALTYPLYRSPFYHLFALGGMKFTVNHREEKTKQIRPGALAGGALIIPLHQRILFRTDIRLEYSLGGAGFGGSALCALQTAF